MSDQPVTVTYEASDFRALYRACRACKKSALLILGAIPAFFTVLAYLDGLRGADLVYEALPYLFIAVLVVALFYLVAPLSSVRSRRKMGWNEAMEVQLKEEGLSVRHPAQDTLFHWTAVHDVAVRDGRLFLFISPGCAIILPQRVFSDSDQFAEWADRAESLWRAAKCSPAE